MAPQRWLTALVLVVWSALSAASSLPDFTEIVEDSAPAVVKILVEYKAGQNRAESESFDHDALPDYLKRFFDPRGMPNSPRPRSSMGSGFVLTKDGYIVTNNHVVEGADAVVVRFSDRQEYDAVIVGLDELSDLALLKIEAEDLPTLPLAQPDELKVGEWVLAIGSPFGLDFSVTAGIVSAMGRSLPTETNDNYVPFIQTDVAINPGNSGGPLFNLAGEVVGVNSQIYTRSGGSIGLSFAIPVSVVRDVVDQLRDGGQVKRGWLGVSIPNVDKNLAEGFGLDRPRGALVVDVVDESPAAEAGLQSGDVITTFDGESIETSSQLPHVVGLVKPGSKVEVSVMRDGTLRTLNVEVGALPERSKPVLASAQSSAENLLGLVVKNADQQTLEALGLSAAVVVDKVVPESPAAAQGILPGDAITMVGSSPIRSVADFDKAVAQLDPGQSIPLRLNRRGSPMFRGLRVPSP
jgi:serine protease Do